MSAAAAYACMWFSVSVAVITGLLITKDPSCLAAFIICLFISYKEGKDENN